MFLTRSGSSEAEMTILYYYSRKIASQDVAERLQGAIQDALGDGTMESYDSVESLCSRLCCPKNDVVVVILLAATTAELFHLLSARDFFEGSRIILVLPDGESTTISVGHKLRPRLLAFVDSDFREVTAVVEKMVRTSSPLPDKWSKSGKEMPAGQRIGHGPDRLDMEVPEWKH
jgi:hypothetical protein